MKNLKIYNREQIAAYEGSRAGAELWSKNLQLLENGENTESGIADSDAAYVLFGISEDIGVRGNYGKPGARNAWEAALRALTSVQGNAYNDASKVLLLGYFDFSDLDPAKGTEERIEPPGFHAAVEAIDRQVSALVEIIVKSGKIPIVIGGGHNNAYGMLKGTSLGLGKSINALNIDAHADLRPRDYRHSGNGFSYALEHDFLDRYYIFGLHENYITRAIADTMESRSEKVHFSTYEEMSIRGEKNLKEEAKEALKFVAKNKASFGLEIDCDVIENIPASARTPSGFSVETLRWLNHFFSRSPTIAYIHICEAAPNSKSPEEMSAAGKLIAYLVTDFIR